MGTPVKHTTRSTKRKPVGKSRNQAFSKSKLPDLSNDPYFVKKADSARRLLQKTGIL